MAKANVIKSLPCGSGAAHSVKVDFDREEVTVRVPSNGKRGALHQAAYDVSVPIHVDSDGHLGMWDCPIPECGYADSTYVDPKVRADLS